MNISGILERSKMVTLKDVEELGFEFVSKKKDKVMKHVDEYKVPENVRKALVEAHKARSKMMGVEEPFSAIEADDGTKWSCLYNKKLKKYGFFSKIVDGTTAIFENGEAELDFFIADGDEHLCGAWIGNEELSDNIMLTEDSDIDSLKKFIEANSDLMEED